MMARLLWYLDPPTHHQLKKPVKFGPPLTKFSGSAHVLALLNADLTFFENTVDPDQHYLSRIHNVSVLVTITCLQLECCRLTGYT